MTVYDLLVRSLALTAALSFAASIACILLGLSAYAVASAALSTIAALVSALGHHAGAA